MVSIRKKQRGFSLIELLVTLAISVLVVSGVLLRFNAFDSVLALKGEAYRLALTIREAQVWSVSAGIDYATGNFDNRRIGVHVDLGEPNQYTLFVDSNSDGYYDTGERILENYKLRESFEISELCLEAQCNQPHELFLTFERPEFDTIFEAKKDTGNTINTDNDDYATIKIQQISNASEAFIVEIGITGQINVYAAP